MSDWLDISTAPKDGTFILALENFTRVDDYDQAYPPEQMVVRWSEKAKHWSAFGVIVSSFAPTHWMLPPPPPTTERGG